MKRRHFIRLSAGSTAALVFSRLTSLASYRVPLMNLPDKVTVQSGDRLFQLSLSNGQYTYKDITVTLIQQPDAVSVQVSSPTQPLNAVKLTWKYAFVAGTKVLGDALERSYGDLGWETTDLNQHHPWYVFLHDGLHTACFGVKTGCNTLCSWAIQKQGLELTMDTSSGGIGVMLGQRELYAATIILLKGNEYESPFSTAQRFCKLLCPNPRLPLQPVYGINDWYFAYG